MKNKTLLINILLEKVQDLQEENAKLNGEVESLLEKVYPNKGDFLEDTPGVKVMLEEIHDNFRSVVEGKKWVEEKETVPKSCSECKYAAPDYAASAKLGYLNCLKEKERGVLMFVHDYKDSIYKYCPAGYYKGETK